MKRRVLIVDDDLSMCELLEADLKRRGFEASYSTSAREALAMKDRDWDVILTDLNMPDMTGIELCERIVANRPDVPVLVLTAFGSLETAVAAIRAGAYDFVSKPIELDMLALTVKRAVEHRGLQEKVKILSRTVERSRKYGELIGASAPMQKLFERMDRIAEVEASVLITGESGTGKELVAKALHKRSKRADGPFVAVNCPALPETLLESELFGHVRGAFTDARSSSKGLFVQADRGTVFLDEIGDMPPSLQPKLLRALEERVVRPVGGTREIPFDARLLTATNQDLEAAVDEGRFRKDLFFRINVIPLEVPPLRSRGTDILLIAQRFLKHFAAQCDGRVSGISKPAARKLLAYSWPGNVRELRNAVERAVALTRYQELAVEDLPKAIRSYKQSHLSFGGADPEELVSMDKVEKRYILHVLRSVGGNRTLAAKILGFDRKTLYRKLLRLGYEDEARSDDAGTAQA